MKTAVVGASGYAGSELLRLIGAHRELDLVLATGDSAAGRHIAEHVPSLAALYRDHVFAPTESVFDSDAEVVFLALPHGHSQRYVPQLLAQGRTVLDLGADFRLRDPQDYAEWYGGDHTHSELLASAVYGLVERHRDELPGATLVAVPGCYPTASALALGPFLDAGLIESTNVIINALSGASGAGRALSDRLHFSRMHANAEAYGLVNHRHTIEIQQEIAATVLFTPHLVPVSRGMLVTAYARVRDDMEFDPLALLAEVYAHDPYVVVSNEPPTLKDPLGSNLCFVSAVVDPRTGWLVAMSSLDNLTKGAAGQAIQAANVVFGWHETEGLPLAGITP